VKIRRGKPVTDSIHLCGWYAVVDDQDRVFWIVPGSRTRDTFEGRPLREDGSLGRRRTFWHDGSVMQCEVRLEEEERE
jgi:hypothetical protein